MSDEKESAREWHVLGASVTGASHILKKMPNQDAIYWKSGDGFPFVLALADGHGSEKYFRSGSGAHFAVEIAVAELELFARAFPERISNIPLFQHLVKQLPERIVEKWRERVTTDLEKAHFFTDEEWQRFGNGTALPETPDDPLLSYGSTLLTVLVTPFFILYLQLGDGDIVLVDEAGQVSKPMPDDKRLLANETTSLCSPAAAQDFRIRCDYLDGPTPTLILLSSDGYANSFTNEAGFLRVGSDILGLLRTDGLTTVRGSIGEWLTAATEQGSGDDITLGMLYHELPVSSLHGDAPAPAEADDEISEQTEDHPIPQAATSTVDGEEVPAVVDGQEVLPTDDAPVPDDAVSVAPEVLTVSLQANEGNYTSIREALMQARAHTRIEIGPGTYYERLSIDKDVELVGTGEAGSTVIAGPSPCFSLQADHAMLQNLTIQGQQTRPTLSLNAPAVVEIIAGSSVLDHCQVSGGRVGVRIHGAATTPTLQNCEVHDTLGMGIVFSGGAQGSLLDSRVYANKLFNVEIAEGSHPTIGRSLIEESKKGGMLISKGSSGTIEGCAITGNAATGIEICDNASPTFLDCSISNNQGHGILFVKQGKGKISGCQIVSNKVSGIAIHKNCQPVIEHCRLQKGDGPGMLIDGRGAGGVIEHCEITGNKTAGILLKNRSQPVIRGCTIQDNEGAGILIQQKGQGVIENCTLGADASHGLIIDERGRRLVLHGITTQEQ